MASSILGWSAPAAWVLSSLATVLLSFDTATPLVTVAIHDGKNVVTERLSELPMKHGEQLAPLIEAAMADTGLARQVRHAALASRGERHDERRDLVETGEALDLGWRELTLGLHQGAHSQRGLAKQVGILDGSREILLTPQDGEDEDRGSTASHSAYAGWRS